jgi:glycerophosphoryl diester phosphodiesterase
MSFDPQVLIDLQKHAPGLPRGIVAERYYADPDWAPLGAARKFRLGNLLHAYRTKPHFVAYSVNDLPALAPMIARYLFGMRLLTWTVRTEAERRKARRWANQMIFEGFRP